MKRIENVQDVTWLIAIWISALTLAYLGIEYVLIPRLTKAPAVEAPPHVAIPASKDWDGELKQVGPYDFQIVGEKANP